MSQPIRSTLLHMLNKRVENLGKLTLHCYNVIKHNKRDNVMKIVCHCSLSKRLEKLLNYCYSCNLGI